MQTTTETPACASCFLGHSVNLAFHELSDFIADDRWIPWVAAVNRGIHANLAERCFVAAVIFERMMQYHVVLFERQQDEEQRHEHHLRLFFELLAENNYDDEW